jgi:putative NADH-flavin reductase
VNPQKIALFGTSGEINYRLAIEALRRRHHVTAIVPDKDEFTIQHPNLRIVMGDVKNKDDIRRYAKGHDAIIYTLESTKTQSRELVRITHLVIEAVKNSGVNKLLFAAHPLGLPAETGEEFYGFLKPIINAQREALKLFQSEKELQWEYAHTIEPEAEKEKGKYRISHETLFTHPNGESRIPETEYATALIDEVEKDNIESPLYNGEQRANLNFYKKTNTAIQ